jgi:hypothetical protein
MKAEEIEKRLKSGEKLIYKNNSYFDDWYFIGNEDVKNRITEKQFNKAKLGCKNKDEEDKNNKSFNGQSYRCYYWR